MSQATLRRLTQDEFYRWIDGREGRYELVDGIPVAMAGANRRHDLVVRNGLFALESRLRGRGGPCQPFTADTAVAIPAGNVRYPDLGIDCGTPPDDSMAADVPRLVVEVLSASTAACDRVEKTEEFKTVPSLAYILLVDPEQPRVMLHARGADGAWASERVAGLEAAVALPALDLVLPLAELYAGLEFRRRPYLVDPN